MSELIELSGLWTGQDKNGNPMMTGSIGNASILITKNTFKEEGSNQPDYRLCIGPRKKQDQAEKSSPPQTSVF